MSFYKTLSIALLVTCAQPALAQETPDKPAEAEALTNQHLEESALGVFTSTLMCRGTFSRQQYLDARDQYREVLVWNDMNRREAFRESESVERMLGALGMGIESDTCDGMLRGSQAEFERISAVVGYDPD